MDAVVRHRLLTVRNLLLALPPMLVTVGLAIVACMESGGRHPLTIGPARNVAEAIAMGDAASALRLMESGASIDEIAMIRPGVLSDRAMFATPLETAVLVDEDAAFELLASRGAELPREHLACLAADIGARAVGARLGRGDCRAGAAWERVLARP